MLQPLWEVDLPPERRAKLDAQGRWATADTKERS
jgi:hypothetical protein